MAHPSHTELRWFVDGLLAAAHRKTVQEHLESCEFCREFCDNYRMLQDSSHESETHNTTGAADQAADRLFAAAMRGLVISLSRLEERSLLTTHSLAADGEPRSPTVESLATYYSESPEFILRLMRDHVRRCDYLQLVGEADSGGDVLLRIADLDREYLTDNAGRVDLEFGELESTEVLNWEIRLPDATFSLASLVYDPEQIEKSDTFALESESGDKIQVRLEKKTEGRQIVIQLLALDGRADFEPVRVAICQSKASQIQAAGPRDLLRFELSDPIQEIRIRLFP